MLQLLMVPQRWPEPGPRTQNFPVRSPRSQKATRPGASTSTCLETSTTSTDVDRRRDRIETGSSINWILTGPTGQSYKPWMIKGWDPGAPWCPSVSMSLLRSRLPKNQSCQSSHKDPDTPSHSARFPHACSESATWYPSL